MSSSTFETNDFAVIVNRDTGMVSINGKAAGFGFLGFDIKYFRDVLALMTAAEKFLVE